MDAIEFAGVSKKYGRGKLALNDLDLRVEKGHFFGFVGPNGAGKSTFVNLIAGLTKKTRGKIRLFEEEIKPGSYEYKRKIGFVLEKPFYLEKLSAEEYLLFVGQMYDIDKDIVRSRVEELLRFFQLYDDRRKLIKKYSAGMKKKVSLAAALIHGPELLILDEPFEAIDAVSAKQIRDNLQVMVRSGGTVFLTSHILDIVERLCDQVAIINHGKVVFECSTTDIRERFKDREMKGKYSGLEELFINLVAGGDNQKALSWLAPSGEE